ncbi:MAG: hypothetical protein EOP06_24615, partial [Proteobacteria bacterium]
MFIVADLWQTSFMDSKNDRLDAKNRGQFVALVILAFVAVAVTIVALTPSFRQGFRSFFIPERRVILAKISGDLTGHGMRVTVLKIQTREGLSVEIYDDSNPETST